MPRLDLRPSGAELVGLALVRLAALVVFTLLVGLPPHHPDEWWRELAIVGAVWIAVSNVMLLRWRAPDLAWPVLLVDIVLVALAFEVSGGAHSDLVFAAPLVVPLVAMNVRPRGGALLWILALAVWTVPLAADAVGGEEDGWNCLAIWAAICVFVISETLPVAGVRARARARLAALSEQRLRLTAQLVALEEAGRERVSRELHDGPLQTLFAARQDLDSSQTDAPGSARAALDAALAELTATVDRIGPAEPPGGSDAAGEVRKALAGTPTPTSDAAGRQSRSRQRGRGAGEFARGMRVHAGLRLLAVPCGAIVAYASNDDMSPLFPVMVVATVAWVLASDWRWLWRAPRHKHVFWLFIVDFLVVLPLMIELAGASQSKLWFLAPLYLGLGTGYFRTVQVAVTWAIASLAAATPALIDLAQGVNGTGHELFDWLLVTLFVGLTSVVSASVRDRAAGQIAELSHARQVLTERAAAGENASRARFRRSLTGDPLAALQAARKELENGGGSEAASVERARESLSEAIEGLRNALAAADPRATSADLATALENLVRTRARAADVSGEVWVERAALGMGSEALLFGVARALVESAVNRPGVSALDVRLVRQRGGLSLEVSDDGAGERVAGSLEAFWRDDIALAATLQRVEAAGGRVSVERHGQTVGVRVTLPGHSMAEVE